MRGRRRLLRLRGLGLGGLELHARQVAVLGGRLPQVINGELVGLFVFRPVHSARLHFGIRPAVGGSSGGEVPVEIVERIPPRGLGLVTFDRH